MPPIHNSSADLYKKLDQVKHYSTKEPHNNKKCLQTIKNINQLIGINSFKKVVWATSPIFQNIETQLRLINSPTIHLSGSGACLFMNIDTISKAKQWEEKIRKKLNKCQVIMVKSCHTALKIIKNAKN